MKLRDHIRIIIGLSLFGILFGILTGCKLPRNPGTYECSVGDQVVRLKVENYEIYEGALTLKFEDGRYIKFYPSTLCRKLNETE